MENEKWREQFDRDVEWHDGIKGNYVYVKDVAVFIDQLLQKKEEEIERITKDRDTIKEINQENYDWANIEQLKNIKLQARIERLEAFIRSMKQFSSPEMHNVIDEALKESV